MKCGKWIFMKDRTPLCHLLLLWFLTFSIILPLFGYFFNCSCYRKFWKQKWKASLSEERKINDQRISNAFEFLASYNVKLFNNSRDLDQTRKTNDVGISIISVSRNRHRLDNYEPYYLTQVATRFLELLSKNDSLVLRYKLYLCNVDPFPSTYFEIKNLSFIPTFQKYSKDVIEKDYWKILSVSSRLEKEKKDYIYCGQKMLDQNFSFVFLVEDDAFPHDDLFPVLDSVLIKHVIKQSTIHRHHQDITFLKFYHPSQLLDYISIEPERIPELLGLSSILSLIMTGIYTKLRPSVHKNFTIIWFILCFYVAMVLLCTGRLGLLELRRLSKWFYQVVPAPSCCTPGMLYPKKGMTEVINYFKSIRCKEGFGKDIALEQFRKSHKKTALMIQPNLFTHIGIYSTLRNTVPIS